MSVIETMSRNSSAPAAPVSPAGSPNRLASQKGKSTAAQRRASELPTTAPLDITFSLDSPPPVHIAAQDLLKEAIHTLPHGVPRPCASCALSREACVLCVHAFWYAFCCLRQPSSEHEVEALLEMMSQQMARLTLRLCCDRDDFFTAFPPVLAHAVLQALRRHALLAAPEQAAAALRHLVGLFGGSLPPKLLARHLTHAERHAATRTPGGTPLAAAPAAAPPAGGDPRAARPPPPLASHAVPPMLAEPRSPATPGALPSASLAALRAPAAAGASAAELAGGCAGGCASPGGRVLASSRSAPALAAADGAEAAAAAAEAAEEEEGGWEEGEEGEEGERRLASLHALLGIGARREPRRARPARMLVDLRRQSPLVAMQLRGAAARGAAGLGASHAASLGSLASAAASGGGGGGGGGGEARPHYGVTRATHVRQSVPTARCALGGVESYRAMRVKGAEARAAALSERFDETCREAARSQRLMRRAVADEARKMDAQQAEVLAKPAAQLSEHASLLAARLLHRDLMTRFTPT